MMASVTRLGEGQDALKMLDVLRAEGIQVEEKVPVHTGPGLTLEWVAKVRCVLREPEVTRKTMMLLASIRT